MVRLHIKKNLLALLLARHFSATLQPKTKYKNDQMTFI